MGSSSSKSKSLSYISSNEQSFIRKEKENYPSLTIHVTGTPFSGKTSLIFGYANDIFYQNKHDYTRTEYVENDMNIGGNMIRVYFRDNIKFGHVSATKYIGVDAIIYMVDLSRNENVDIIRTEISDIRKLNNKAKFYIVGNKTDKDEIKQNNELHKYIEYKDFNYFEVSVKNKLHVDDLLQTILYDSTGLSPSRAKSARK